MHRFPLAMNQLVIRFITAAITGVLGGQSQDESLGGVIGK